MPNEPPPASTSPLSLRTILWYLFTREPACRMSRGGAPAAGLRRLFLGRFLDERGFANFETHEARNRDILAHFGDHRLDQIAHRGGVFADEGLVIEAHLLVELVHPPVHDLV